MLNKVIVADNQSVFRTGAARIMATEEDFRIVGQCDDLPRLEKAVAGSLKTLILMAASLRPDVAALTKAARENGGYIAMILEIGTSPVEYLAQGVTGIIFRDVSNPDLLRCLRTIGRGQSFVQKRTDGSGEAFETDMVGDRVRERLTPKELKIVALILQGYKNKDIAEELRNTEQVIKNYLRSIFDKTGVSDRLELALFAMHHKILSGRPAVKNREYTGSVLLSR